jgi:hypothetical protein
MLADVIEARPTGHLEFEVTFSDGVSGRVRMRPSHLYGVFEKLQDPAFFQQLQVKDGFVS